MHDIIIDLVKDIHLLKESGLPNHKPGMVCKKSRAYETSSVFSSSTIECFYHSPSKTRVKACRMEMHNLCDFCD
ncbi:hypothetical protein Y1Q_0003823 [Alligator mississippiensis]|uniref:Uncharacterized protein n=1 Tax=Alligator mississippiensis TaxID=8496 RepID=A0A151MNF5_ALLMI|nr:hypothetical protein Y1Q_0003823 [Alligator mississippiensis]